MTSQTLGQRMLDALEAAIGEALHRPTLPPLTWSVDLMDDRESKSAYLPALLDALPLLGNVGAEYEESEVPAILLQWATELHLAPVQTSDPSTLEYAGTFEGHPITVWGIVDRARWDHDTNTVPTTRPDAS
jgi:hypothetical protein